MIRSRKSTKPEAAKNKTITGRVAKSSASKSKLINTNEDTSVHFGGRTPPQEAQARKNAKVDDLNLEEAIKRRLDWTPPKSSPFFPHDKNEALSQADSVFSGFGNFLHDYRYSKDTEVAENQAHIGENSKPTKRRRIEVSLLFRRYYLVTSKLMNGKAR